jgi:hypothetical protein
MARFAAVHLKPPDEEARFSAEPQGADDLGIHRLASRSLEFFGPARRDLTPSLSEALLRISA